jgi:glucose/arabinose dehydrogenase
MIDGKTVRRGHADSVGGRRFVRGRTDDTGSVASLPLFRRKGSLINGALKIGLLSRLTLDGDKAVKEERLLANLHERIRDVRQGPDGALYLLTDKRAGRILRVAPAK